MGNRRLGWTMSPAVGSSGGFLCCWDDEFFKMEKEIVEKRFILLVGCIIGQKVNVGIGNVHVPNSDAERLVLWET